MALRPNKINIKRTTKKLFMYIYIDKNYKIPKIKKRNEIVKLLLACVQANF